MPWKNLRSKSLEVRFDAVEVVLVRRASAEPAEPEKNPQEKHDKVQLLARRVAGWGVPAVQGRQQPAEVQGAGPEADGLRAA